MVIHDGKKYRNFKLEHASFGSIQAIFVATIVSEALCSWINKRLMVPSTIYITNKGGGKMGQDVKNDKKGKPFKEVKQEKLANHKNS